MPKLYLICVCGEAFDEVPIAAEHAETCGDQAGNIWQFDIQTEDEAF